MGHKLGVAAAVATLVSLVIAAASFVYDRMDNRRADPAPAGPVGAAAPPPSSILPALPSSAPAAPAPASSAPATAESYVKVHDVARWTIPAPRSSCGRTYVDLDTEQPSSRVNSDNTEDDDLLYWQCSPVGLQLEKGQAMGRAPKKPPATGSACEAMARQDAVASNLEPGDLNPRKDAFCVVTGPGNVAWLNLLAKETVANSDPNLVFRLVVWHYRPA
ncbi:hypothetical protein [Jidongwangia harbinensis]|uniref:hypothetical protein n=1 Tax=Jidongwangia harbinensis TaxID=2878561 RepID=UPI001CDA4910|nr:hypothetical protein [Jidongwangia harbinensis]MCA2216531.1 hypothetical protein [Jidongwangia harbinensis]